MLTETSNPVHMEENLMAALGRILEAEREFNRREGITEKDHTLPERFLKEPLKEGPSAGSVVELDEMLEAYREL